MSKNFAVSTIAGSTAPGVSGTSFTVPTGHGARFTEGAPAVVYPAGTLPSPESAEVVTVSDVVGDVLTVVRAVESSTPRTVVLGDQLVQGITAAMWDALAAAVAGKADTSALSAYLTTAAATGTYARLGVCDRKAVGWGDSITAGGVGSSYYDLMCVASMGKIRSVRNAGVAGERSGQILARFAADVAPYLPAKVYILVGANDLADGAYTRAISTANLDSMISLVRSGGGEPIVLSLCPNTTSRAKVALYNRAYANLCELRRVRYVDIYTTMTDPSTGTFRSGYSTDGVHPAPAGVTAMLTAVLAQTSDMIGGGAMLCVDNTDSANLMTGGLHLVDTNADGLSNSWSGVNNPAGFTTDRVTGDAAIQGTWQRLTMAATIGFRTIQQTTTTGFAVGDTIRLSARVKASGLTNEAVWSIGYITGTGGTYNYAHQSVATPIDGIVEKDFVVPVGTTTIGLHWQIKTTASGASDGVMQVAQAGLYNLTTAGGLT